MGMFDSFYEGGPDEWEGEWQTKAYGCLLDVYRLGDEVPPIPGVPESYQVLVLGESHLSQKSRYSLAEVRDHVVVGIDVQRDPGLPFVDYFGHVTRYQESGDD